MVYEKNLYHSQAFQKQTDNKNVIPKNYIPSEKIQLNSKYIKIKQNFKLEGKFFDIF